MSVGLKQRLWLATVLVCQSFVCGVATSNWVASLLIIVVILIGISGRWQLGISTEKQRFFIYPILLFIILRMYAGDDSTSRLENILLAGAYLGVAMQLVAFFLVDHRGRIPSWSHCLSLFGMAGFCSVAPKEALPSLGVCFGVYSLVLLGLLRNIRPALRGSATSSRGAKAFFLVPILIVALSLAFGSVYWVDSNQELLIAQAVNVAKHLFLKPEAGKLGATKLGSHVFLPENMDSAVALRVYSPSCPQRLRGRCHDRFDGQSWRTSFDPQACAPTSPKAFRDRMEEWPFQAFSLRSSFVLTNTPMELVEVFPENTRPNFLMLPSSAMALAAPPARYVTDSCGSVSLEESSFVGRYAALRAKEVECTPAQLSDAERTAYLQLPSTLSPAVSNLAVRLDLADRSSAWRIRRVQDFVSTNNTYRLGIDVPKGRDPLAYFLIDRAPAHCEYFATAAAVLLRLVDVPTRYVGGYICREWNPYGEYWLSRAEHAHAWIEAYDESIGAWVTVDATPNSGWEEEFGKRKEKAGLAEWLDAWRFRWSQWIFKFKTGQWREALLDAGEQGLNGLLHLTRWPGLLVPLAIVGFLFVRTYQHRRKRRIAIDEWNRMLLRMDRMAARAGMERRQAETLHQFARRLRAADPAQFASANEFADWYESYACARYALNSADDALYGKMLKQQNQWKGNR